MSAASTRPPRDGLVRLWAPGIELRAASAERAGSSAEVMAGHFAVFNRWTEIDSWFEGHFMERISPGAFKKTFKDNRSSIKVLFQHGRDPQIGSKPLGPIRSLGEDSTGANYEVELLDAPYVRETLLPGLRENLYGASFRFSVMREDWVQEPKVSADNPQGIPERTIKEMRVSEFGPVTFPAYEDATAGVRSVTDDFLLSGLAGVDSELVRMAGQGADLAELLAHRLGLEAGEKPKERERITVRESKKKDETEAEREETPEKPEEADGDTTGDANVDAAPAGTTDGDSTDADADVVNDGEKEGSEEGSRGREPLITNDDILAAADDPKGKPPGWVPAWKREHPPIPGRDVDPPRQREGEPEKDYLAAPGSNPTPLHGNRKEPWRL